MQQLKTTIYLKKKSASFRNPWVELHVDEYQINNETRFLELIRYNGANTIINLNEVIAFDVEYE